MVSRCILLRWNMNGNPQDAELVWFFGHDDIHCPKRVMADLRKQEGTYNDGFQTFQMKAFCGPRVVGRRVGISAKKVAPVNFLIDPLDGRPTLRPADILIFG
ncbi:hypothetical protein Tco_0792428 [Tanacetum coccineum]